MIDNIKKIIAGIMAALIALGGGVYVVEEMRGGGDPPGLVKVWDANNKTVIIGSDKGIPEMAVKLISSEPDLCTFTEIFEVTNFKAFTPHKDKDFKARTVKHTGKGDVQAVEWFIEQNVSYTVNITDYKIIQVEKVIYNNETGKNETGKNETMLVNETTISGYHDETRYKNVWQDYAPFRGKPVSKDTVQRIKVVYHKPPEIGEVNIRTIPMFRGVECDELTWWNTSWDNKREIKINNTGGSALSYYQVNINLSSTPINSTSLRVVNETADATVPHWQETISSGNCTELWFNATSIPASAWLNGTYYIYYGNADAASDWDGAATFIAYHGSASANFIDSLIIPYASYIWGGRVRATASTHNVQWGLGTVVDWTDDAAVVQSYSGDNSVYHQIMDNGTSSSLYESPATLLNQWYKGKITFDGTTSYGYFDGNEIGSGGITTNLPNENMGLLMYSFSGTQEQEWSFARKYTATEPTVTLGAEEEPTITIDSYAPATPLDKTEGDSQTFNVTASEDCECRWYIDGALVQTNSTPSTTHAYTNASLALGNNQNFSACVNNSTKTDMQTWDVTVTAIGAFQQSVYKDSWQYVTNLNSTDRTFSQFFSQMSAYYLVHYNKTAQRTYSYKGSRWEKYASYNIPSGDVAMLRYTANDTITRDNAGGTFSGTLKTGLNQIGHSYNGARNLTWYNTTIASSNVSTITFSYPINGTTKIYTYGSSANGTVDVAQGFGVEINVTTDTAFTGI